MRKYKVLFMVIAVVMLFQCAVTGNAAALIGNRYPETQVAEPGTWTSFAHINPLYADVMTENELASGDLLSTVLVQTIEDTEWLTDLDIAGEKIRDAMIERQETIVVNLDVQELDIANPTDAASLTALKDFARDVFYRAFTHNGTPHAGDYLRWTYGGYSGGFSYYVNAEETLITYIEIVYIPSYYTTYDEEQQVDAAVARLVDGWNKIGVDTEYEKASVIYNFICDNVAYDYENFGNDEYKTQFTAYGALINGTSVCQGYANLFYRLALEMGLDARIVSGDGVDGENREPHSWNIVEIADQYYNLDAAWDSARFQQDSRLSYDYYLKNAATFDDDHIRDTGYTTDEFNTAYPMAEENYHSNETAAGTYDNGVAWNITDGVLVISGEGYIPDDAKPWEEHAERIFSINIENGITSIGKNTFNRLPACYAVEIAGSVKNIGVSAFAENVCLKYLGLNEGTETLGMEAFYSTSVHYAWIPSTVTSIDWSYSVTPFLNAFEVASGNTMFKTMDDGSLVTADGASTYLQYPAGRNDTAYAIPYGINNVNCHAIDRTNLEVLVLPNTLTSINGYAFTENHRLTEIRISAAVVSIGTGAFGWSDNLTEAYFYGDYTDGLSAYMFEPDLENPETVSAENRKVMTIYYPEGNPTWEACTWDETLGYILTPFDNSVLADGLYWSLINGDLKVWGSGAIPDYSFGDTVMAPWYAYAEQIETITVAPDDGCEISIGTYAFQCCGDVNSITLNEGVTNINGYAFADVSLPADVSLHIPSTAIIEWCAFACADINSYTVAENDNGYIVEAGGMMLYYEDANSKVLLDAGNDLSAVVIPEGVTSIAGTAFDRCGELTYVSIPKSVTYIGSNVFDACDKLSEVSFMGHYTGLTIDDTDMFDEIGTTVTVWVPAYADGWDSFFSAGHSNCNKGFFIYAGDVNQDIVVDDKDALLLSQYYAGLDVTIDYAASDVNGDGEYNRKDAMVLNRYIAQWEGIEAPGTLRADV